MAASLNLRAPPQDMRCSVSEQVVPRKSVVPQAFLSGCSVLGGVDQQLQQTLGLAFRCLRTSRETPSVSSQCLFYDCEGKGGRRQLVWSICLWPPLHPSQFSVSDRQTSAEERPSRVWVALISKGKCPPGSGAEHRHCPAAAMPKLEV